MWKQRTDYILYETLAFSFLNHFVFREEQVDEKINEGFDFP